jgi:hypothetical protein
MRAIFDSQIKSDNEYPVEKVSAIPESLLFTGASEVKLQYTSTLKLWDNVLRSILDNTQISTAEKVQFLIDARNDKSTDAFQYIFGRQINFWKQSPEAKNIAEDYFNEKQFHLSVNPFEKYKYFEFQTKNLLPGSSEAIIAYFQSRSTVNEKYDKECELIYNLIQLGCETDAVNYFETLTLEFVEGKNNTYSTRIYGEPESIELFEIFCFSKNEKNAQKGKAILIYLLTSVQYNADNLYRLLEYLDSNEYKKLLKKWHDYYKGLSFFEYAAENASNTSGQSVNNNPEIQSYFSFTVNNLSTLAEIYGIQLWDEFVKHRNIWQKSNNYSYMRLQLLVAENIFFNCEVPLEEKKSILFQIQKTDNFFSENDYYGRFEPRYLKLVNMAFPDWEIEYSEFEKLGLGEIAGYTKPVNIHSSAYEVVSRETNIPLENAREFLRDINSFAQKNNLLPITDFEKEEYHAVNSTYHAYLFKYLEANDYIAWFDAESADSPVNYNNFFKEYFQPHSIKSGISEISVAQETVLQTGGMIKYDIYVKCKDLYLKHSYEEHGTDWYSPQRLIKMLNICLIEINSKYRFIEIETRDQTAMFCLAEPDAVFSFLNAYSIRCWAINYDDELYNDSLPLSKKEVITEIAESDNDNSGIEYFKKYLFLTTGLEFDKQQDWQFIRNEFGKGGYYNITFNFPSILFPSISKSWHLTIRTLRLILIVLFVAISILMIKDFTVSKLLIYPLLALSAFFSKETAIVRNFSSFFYLVAIFLLHHFISLHLALFLLLICFILINYFRHYIHDRILKKVALKSAGNFLLLLKSGTINKLINIKSQDEYKYRLKVKKKSR